MEKHEDDNCALHRKKCQRRKKKQKKGFFSVVISIKNWNFMTQKERKPFQKKKEKGKNRKF